MADLIRGGDYSRFQGQIDWDKVPAERVLAILGMWDWQNLVVDPQLARNVREAKRTGRKVGGYYRVNPARWPAAAEAKRMLDVLAQHGLDQPGCLWPSVDIEPTNTPADATVNWPKWTRDFFTAWADLTDLPLMVYTSGSWFKSLLGGTQDWPSWAKCWVGHTEQWSSPKGVPTEEWAGKTKHELERAVVHQYSHTGRVSGIAGDVDLDCLMPGVALADITLQDPGGHMGVIAPRTSWGPSYSNGATDNKGNPIIIGTGAWRDIYVHHTVTNVPGGANATVAQEIAHMKTLESIGQNSFGQGISYTVIVFPSGRCYQGHDIDRRGAHTYQRNDTARAICFVGNFENEQPTDKAINGACLVLDEWKAKGYPSRISGGHRDVYATACPGKNLYAALGRIKAGAGTPQEGDGMANVTDAQLAKLLEAADSVLGGKEKVRPAGEGFLQDYDTNQDVEQIKGDVAELKTAVAALTELVEKVAVGGVDYDLLVQKQKDAGFATKADVNSTVAGVISRTKLTTSDGSL